MVELHYEVRRSTETLPIRFSSMKQAIEVAGDLSPEYWNILLAGTCPEGRVCPLPPGECKAGRTGNILTCPF